MHLTWEEFIINTKTKGDLGEIKIISDLIERNYNVSIPFSEDSRYDLIVDRNGNLERMQVKYVESDGVSIKVRCYNDNNRNVKYYTSKSIDWLAAYDKTTDKCYYIHSSEINKGRTEFTLRLEPPLNNQIKGIRFAKDYLKI